MTKFETLLYAMLIKPPKVLEKKAAKLPASNVDVSVGYSWLASQAMERADLTAFGARNLITVAV